MKMNELMDRMDKLRMEMYELMDMLGNTHPLTVQKSQELDVVLNEYAKLKVAA